MATPGRTLAAGLAWIRMRTHAGTVSRHAHPETEPSGATSKYGSDPDESVLIWLGVIGMVLAVG